MTRIFLSKNLIRIIPFLIRFLNNQNLASIDSSDHNWWDPIITISNACIIIIPMNDRLLLSMNDRLLSNRYHDDHLQRLQISSKNPKKHTFSTLFKIDIWGWSWIFSISLFGSLTQMDGSLLDEKEEEVMV